MDIERRMELATRGSEEIITEHELRSLFETCERPRGYIGVEPSGLFHIGWSIWAKKLSDLVEAGMDMTVLEATWHAAINDKLGGEIEKIRKCAKYLEHCLFALGVDRSKIHLVTAEDLMSSLSYWELMIKSSKIMSLARVKRAMTIMGRKASEAEMDFSKFIYPSLQVTDIFALNLSTCLGGIDQRRAHMLAREIAQKFGFEKPVAIHTPLLMALGGAGRMEATRRSARDLQIELKMSKSDPKSAIFIHDTPEEFGRKLDRAYCPPKEIKYNPVLDIDRKIIFNWLGSLRVERPSEYGGPIEFFSFNDLIRDYSKGNLHPADLKTATAQALAEIFKSVSVYFDRNKEASELLIAMKGMPVTR